jgi:hypothetical protein
MACLFTRLLVFFTPFSFSVNALYDMLPSFRGSVPRTHVEYESELDKNLYLSACYLHTVRPTPSHVRITMQELQMQSNLVVVNGILLDRWLT